jgi:hypothetical protein
MMLDLDFNHSHRDIATRESDTSLRVSCEALAENVVLFHEALALSCKSQSPVR